MPNVNISVSGNLKVYTAFSLTDVKLPCHMLTELKSVIIILV